MDPTTLAVVGRFDSEETGKSRSEGVVFAERSDGRESVAVRSQWRLALDPLALSFSGTAEKLQATAVLTYNAFRLLALVLLRVLVHASPARTVYVFAGELLNPSPSCSRLIAEETTPQPSRTVLPPPYHQLVCIDFHPTKGPFQDSTEH